MSADLKPWALAQGVGSFFSILISEFQLDQKEAELKKLMEEVENKSKKLASNEMEMESYKRTTEERIFKLEAKVKELESKTGELPITS